MLHVTDAETDSQAPPEPIPHGPSLGPHIMEEPSKFPLASLIQVVTLFMKAPS